jgi:hypothetical protein
MREKKEDPSAEIEDVLHTSKSELVEVADKRILPRESGLNDAGSEENVKKQLRMNKNYQHEASLWFYKLEGATKVPVKRKLGKLCEIGDDYKDTGADAPKK